ncbi:flagellin [Rhizobium sp. L1K21]|uniref:flagellin N-terminal helical domain-containing protein n=1 Tax=Rhizobium sp. L1K21 TaxID=2954933 RepID=UPI0020933F29|nr:flagellin [Rhizobium sp. L1K21]MCO6185439.1 flagellar hook associated protein [Rhizobium sp. L1K21]
MEIKRRIPTMSGISINATAASAVALLTGSTSALERTNKVVASGKEVNAAQDNAAYWSIAKSMSSNSTSMSAAMDASGLAQATADTAALGMEQATNLVSDIRNKLILAKSVSGTQRDAVNAEISQLKEQLSSVSESTSFSGQNWLSTGAAEKPGTTSLVAGVSANEDSSINVETLDFDTNTTNLVAKGDAADGLLTKSYTGTTPAGNAYDYKLLDAGSTTPSSGQEISVSANTTNDELDGMISAMDGMLSSMTDAGAKLGATQSRITMNTDFMQRMQDVTDRSVARLVDANMEEQAVNMAAQKVQVQLQTTALNIANQQPQNMLMLFA